MSKTRAHLSLVVSRPRGQGEIKRPTQRRVVIRPGDRREPMPVKVDQTLMQLAAEAAARGLELDQAAGLLVERALALRDAESLGIPSGAAREALDSAVNSLTRLAVPASTARYVRSLVAQLATARPREAEGVRQLALPVRLIARAAALDFAKVLVARDLDEAIRFEIAAASCGRTMSEWAMFVLASAAKRRGRARHTPRAGLRASS
jgi:hypothetical protein